MSQIHAQQPKVAETVLRKVVLCLLGLGLKNFVVFFYEVQSQKLYILYDAL